jgi:cytoskeletal protein RodZ
MLKSLKFYIKYLNWYYNLIIFTFLLLSVIQWNFIIIKFKKLNKPHNHKNPRKNGSRTTPRTNKKTSSLATTKPTAEPTSSRTAGKNEIRAREWLF